MASTPNDSTNNDAAAPGPQDGADNAADGRIVRKRVASLKECAENEQLYRPPTRDDPKTLRLAESIKQNGCDPLVVTEDNYILSGHRRRLALLINGQEFVRCRVRPIRYEELTIDERLKLLRTYNLQRDKSVAEQVREELVDINPAEAHRRLRSMRDKSINAAEYNGAVILDIEGTKRRHTISDDKAEHVKFIRKVVFEDRRDYWPLSGRAVHYALLNYKFVRGYHWPHRDQPGYGTRQVLQYENNSGSYDATLDLLVRLRLNGEIPWKAMDDPTRPVREFRPFRDARQFVNQEVKNLFGGYWRDLLQTQPNYIECVVEKNSVYRMVLRVTEKYQIWTSSGRGFNAIDPWHDLYERYQASGKRRLILIILSDYDPEGEMIAQVGGRTLRDDFFVLEDDLRIIKAGVTREQIRRYRLPQQNFAKESSSNHEWFVNRNGGDDSVYELEALDPEDMLRELDKVILSVIDVELFNREVAAEQAEAAYLEAARGRAAEALRGLGE